MARDKGPTNKGCNPRCPDCQTPWTCDAEQDDWQGIEMYDTPFQLIDDLVTWTFIHRWEIATACVTGAFALGIFITYFWS